MRIVPYYKGLFCLQCPSSVFDSECLARINSNDDSLGELLSFMS